MPGQARRGTRERLIEAAAELIAEEGYDRAGVQAIARRAGLTNGAIYANFRDRAELLAEAIEMRLPGLLETIEQGRQAGAAPGDVLALIGRSLGTGTPDPDRRLLTEAWTAAWRDPAVGALLRERLERIESAVADLGARARADGDLAADVDPATLARFGSALALGYHLIHTAGVPDPDREEWERLAERVLSSLRTAGDRHPTCPPAAPRSARTAPSRRPTR